MNKTIYIDDLVIEMINKEIQDKNVNTDNKVIVIESEQLKKDIVEAVRQSKHCKVCKRNYQRIPTHNQSYCPPCRREYMKIYKRNNKNSAVKTPRNGLDLTKESQCCSCNQVKPISEFYKANVYKCKVCIRIIQKERSRAVRKHYKELKEQTKQKVEKV